MEIKRLKTKGETMIERAESQFWAYEIDENDVQKDLVLLDNVQFIYELSLAELELKALGIDFEVTNGLREFRILNKSDEQKELIKRKGTYYKTITGQFTDYFQI
ncbi:MAG: hypothetical protein ABIK27_02835, partial [Bacteroidota bacterium]